MVPITKVVAIMIIAAILIIAVIDWYITTNQKALGNIIQRIINHVRV